MALLRRLSVCTTSVNRKTARKRIGIIVLARGAATAQTERLQLRMGYRISRQRFSRFLSATPGKFRDSIPTTQWLLPAHCSTFKIYSSSCHSALHSDVRHFKSRNFRLKRNFKENRKYKVNVLITSLKCTVGDTTGGGTVMLWPVRFHCFGVWISTEPPCVCMRIYSVGWDSSVGIATRYGLDGPGIESR